MVRAPSIDKYGIKRGEWSEEEDNKLKAYVLGNGNLNWRQLPRLAGLARCGKSCRLRWKNYLMPGIRRGSYTKEEVEVIMKLREEHGNKWSLIASHLPGRTDNEIKNYWHTHLKKCTKADQPSRKQSPKVTKRLHQMKVMDSMEHTFTSMSLIDQEAQVKEIDVDFTSSFTEVFTMSCNSTFIQDMQPMASLYGNNGGFGNDLIAPRAIYDSALSDATFGGFEIFWNEPFLLDTSNSLFSPSISCESALTNGPFDGLESFCTEPFLLNSSNNLMSPATNFVSALTDGSFGKLESSLGEPFLSNTSNSLISPTTSCNSGLTEGSLAGLECFLTEHFLVNTSNCLISPSTSCSSVLTDGQSCELESFRTEAFVLSPSGSLISPSTNRNAITYWGK